ncbi:MAG TPA: PKD domain-containing protein, partial [Solirubrobacteraceae bacterium]|nr:PKD domain-containing protein [Solirubrobacteraceae bacterium]
QWAFSSVGATSGKGIQCWQGTELAPHFTATNPVNGGDLVAFDANESGIALAANVSELKLGSEEPYTAPLYKWEFGDGTSIGPVAQASILHSYQYAGAYPVTLTVTDSAGNIGVYTQTIPVAGPPRPAPEPTPVANPPVATTAPAVAPATPPGAGGAAPGPVLTQSVLSSSLRKATKLGLPIHYQVNEQVAGQAEALLAASIAAKLGIKARRAYGLPAGYPRLVVVGSAVLVTTKGGQGTVRISFAKAVAKRLARAHRLTLTLRFVLHSASRPPSTTSQLSTVSLSK